MAILSLSTLAEGVQIRMSAMTRYRRINPYYGRRTARFRTLPHRLPTDLAVGADTIVINTAHRKRWRLVDRLPPAGACCWLRGNMAGMAFSSAGLGVCACRDGLLGAALHVRTVWRKTPPTTNGDAVLG